jgi:hypothetical protein
MAIAYGFVVTATAPKPNMGRLPANAVIYPENTQKHNAAPQP